MVFSQVAQREAVWDGDAIAACILNLDSVWRSVFGFVSGHLPRGKNLLYTSDRRLGGSRNLSGQSGEDRALCCCWQPTLDIADVYPVACRCTDYRSG
jgi:hypothetical protein